MPNIKIHLTRNDDYSYPDTAKKPIRGLMKLKLKKHHYYDVRTASLKRAKKMLWYPDFAEKNTDIQEIIKYGKKWIRGTSIKPEKIWVIEVKDLDELMELIHLSGGYIAFRQSKYKGIDLDATMMIYPEI